MWLLERIAASLTPPHMTTYILPSVVSLFAVQSTPLQLGLLRPGFVRTMLASLERYQFLDIVLPFVVSALWHTDSEIEQQARNTFGL